MDRPPPETVRCPHCGATNFVPVATCAACGRAFSGPIAPARKPWRIGIGPAMIVVATLAACLAPIRSAPGFSAFLALFLVPTALRAALIIERRRIGGRSLTFQETHDAYFYAFVVTMTMAPAAFIAFVATCVPVGCATEVLVARVVEPSPSPLAISISAGLVASALVMIVSLRHREIPKNWTFDAPSGRPRSGKGP